MVRCGTHGIARTAGSVTVTVQNQSTNASFASTSFQATPNSTINIPLTYLNGADSSCIGVTAGTLTANGLELNVGVIDVSVTVTDTKIKVSVDNQFTAGIEAITPESQFVAPNTIATATIQYTPGYSASDVIVSHGYVSGNTWSIPVGTVPYTASITEWSKVLVEVSNQFPDGIASLSPLSQNVHINTTATVEVQFNAGYSASNVEVSVGTLTGTTWSIPVTSFPVSATISEHTIETKVHIGNTDYDVVRIGDLLWTAANLAEPIPDVSGQSYYRWAHNESDNTNGYGMLYDINSIQNDIGNRRTKLISLFPSGWRIPTIEDMTDLVSHCSSYKDLMRTDKGGNDKYGFAGLDTGQAYSSGGSCFEFTTFQLHMLGSFSYNTLVVSHSMSMYWLKFHNNNLDRMIALRLCKDV
jgi:uncharacterized protein (TIGR02145 family)